MSNNTTNIYNKLIKLMEQGRVTASEFDKPNYFAPVLKNLLDRGIVQRYPSGGGHWSYRLLENDKLAKTIDYYARHAALPETMDKVQATQYVGDAHAATASKYPSVPLRVVTPNSFLHNDKGQIINAYDVCKHGLAIYLPVNEALRKWWLNGTICLVENQRFFWEAEHVFNADYYLYLQGNFNTRIADWLGSEDMHGNSCFYFGDYDPTGIKLYLRMKTRITHCQLFVPDDFEELLAKYGNKNGLTKQHRDFYRLLTTDDQAIQRIRKAFEATGKTLHQEALLIDAVRI